MLYIHQTGCNLCRKIIKHSVQCKKTQIFELEKKGKQQELNPGPVGAEVRFRTLNHCAKPFIILFTLSPIN